MLYAQGFLLAGALATAISLATYWNGPSSAGPMTAKHPTGDTGHIDALTYLSDAVDRHRFPRHRLNEPDHTIADHARDAAELTDGRTRERLLTLADSAMRSALEFLVDYNLAAGDWEAATGLRMSAAEPTSD